MSNLIENKNGIFQEDVLSVLLLIFSMNPLSFMLNRLKGYWVILLGQILIMMRINIEGSTIVSYDFCYRQTASFLIGNKQQLGREDKSFFLERAGDVQDNALATQPKTRFTNRTMLLKFTSMNGHFAERYVLFF